MVNSTITKTSIAESLKELCHSKGFEKITIKDISEKCGINRQTFYYHFQDKYDLLEWIYKTELIDKYTQDISFDNWPEKFFMILTEIKNSKAFYINTITHTEDYMKSSMLYQAQQIFQYAIDSLDETKVVNQAERDFITKFFAYGVCGTIIEWIENGMEASPDEICCRMTTMRDLCEKAAYDFVSDNRTF